MRVIHAADFHLDSPFDGLNPHQAVERRAQQRRLLDRLAELCADRQADLVLLAGDLLDGDAPYQETVGALVQSLGRMKVPVFIAPGNHDYYGPRSPYAANIWPGNVHIFRSGEISCVELPQLNAAVYGAAFSASGREDGPLVGFSAPNDGRIHLMVLHADVDGRQASRYGPVSTRDIACSGLDYLALGHIHSFSGLQWAETTPWAYSGCPEGRGFDETGEKGVLCVDIEAGGSVQTEFVPLCTHRYEVIEIPVTADMNEEDILSLTGQYRARESSVRFVLTGESSDTGIDLQKLQQLCSGDFYSVSFRDKTCVRKDLWTRVGEDTLTGLFLQEMKRHLEEAGDGQTARQLQLATRFGLAALENREDCAP